MSALYSDKIAHHYNAYRPDLHEVIVDKCLSGLQFSNALDIGCGTGISSRALTKYSLKITGIDPSLEMIQQAQHDENIDYYTGHLIDFNFSSASFDLITFAGSLFYAKSQQLMDELDRILQPEGIILIYDFNIVLDTIRALIDLPVIESVYDHSTNLEGLSHPRITLDFTTQNMIPLELSVKELAHLILSDFYGYEYCVGLYKQEDPFDRLVAELKREYHEYKVILEAELYWTKYQKSKS